jgi:prepilin-type N-terminal cleavage/methylation domain-containing protein/prepilin-type processing-associated H-X9-DG protein
MKGAFTLIELLVVIAIIAILGAILLPVFSQAKEQAKSVTCLSTQRQLAISVHLYLQDWEAYPLLNYRNNANPALSNTAIRWFNLLQPYVRADALFECAGAPGIKGGRNMALGYNYMFLGNTHFLPGHPYNSVSESTISQQSRTIAFADSDGVKKEDVASAGGTYVPYFHGFVIDAPESNWSLAPPLDEDAGWCWKGNRCRLSQRHRGGANASFCDGHASWLPYTKAMKNNSLWNGTGEP